METENERIMGDFIAESLIDNDKMCVFFVKKVRFFWENYVFFCYFFGQNVSTRTENCTMRFFRCCILLQKNALTYMHMYKYRNNEP